MVTTSSAAGFISVLPRSLKKLAFVYPEAGDRPCDHETFILLALQAGTSILNFVTGRGWHDQDRSSWGRPHRPNSWSERRGASERAPWRGGRSACPFGGIAGRSHGRSGRQPRRGGRALRRRRHP